MSHSADPAQYPELYRRQEQDPEKKDESAVSVRRPLDASDAEGGLRPVVADAFALGEGEDDKFDFKSLGWIKAGLVATCEAIALGTLSFPSNFAKLGMAGGLICNTGFVLISWISAYLMVDFKIKYPYVMNVADCGEVIFGKWGARVFGIGIVAKSIGLASSHILAGKIAISTFDSGATCSVVWALVIAVGSAILSYQRHWSGLTWISVASLTCITVACIVTMSAAATQDPTVLTKGGAAIEWKAFNNPGLVNGIGAVTNTIFAYGGNMAVFSFLPEMKKPQDFKKSLAIMQIGQLVFYSVVGAVLYRYGGQYTPSPALTMTTHKFAVISYAFALVTIIVSGIVAVNVGAKFAYVSFFRGSPLLVSRGWKAQGAWIAIVASMYAIGFVLAELIPFFSQLLTIVSCLFSTWFVCGLGGIIYFHLVNPNLPENQGTGGWFSSPSRIAGLVVAFLFVGISSAITPLGLYSAIRGIIIGYSNGKFHHPFSCSS